MSQDLFIVTFSKHYGIHEQAFHTFADAWAFAAATLRNSDGLVLHADAQTCYESHMQVVPSLTKECWKVGQLMSMLMGDCHVGPTVIFKLKL
jgi:hypothetical protein